MKRVMKVAPWVAAVMWIGFAVYSTWAVAERIHQLGGNVMHCLVVLIVGVCALMQTLTIAACVERWISGDVAVELSQAEKSKH